MHRPLRVALAACLLLAAAAGAPAADAKKAAEEPPAPAPAPVPDVAYSDLLLHLDNYEGQTVRVHGTFHYLQSDGPIFELRMGDRSVSVYFNGLPPEGQMSLRELRQFSETPLAVTGAVREGNVHDLPIMIIASRIELEGAGSQFTYDSKDGFVTYPEIARFSQRFLHSAVTMQGRFDFREPDRTVFTMWRGVDEIDVDFGRLPDDLQAKLLVEPQFSNRLMTIKGIVRPSPGRKSHYLLEAQSIDFLPPFDANSANAADPSKPRDIAYAEVLAAPEKWAGQHVQMRGSFECAGGQPYVFQMRTGSDSIEFIDERLPAPVHARLASLRPFSEAALRVSGTIRAYPDVKNRYYLVADKVEFVTGS